MAGFRPGFGRGGMTHSLVVMEVGVIGLGAGEPAAATAASGLMQMEGWRGWIPVAGAGARAGGEPAEPGVDAVAGEAMVCVCVWCMENV